MELKVLICDDDKLFVKKLSEDINKYFRKNNIKISIDEIVDSFMMIENFNYDIVFMDIDLALNKMNGIHLSEYLKMKNPRALIIFVSARDDLVFRTFKVQPFQFIRKKQYFSDFNETMRQLIEYIKKHRIFRILSINGRMTMIYMNSIKYIMSIGNDITIYCYDKEYTFRSTMKDLLELLSFQDVVQIQKTLAINLNYVEDFVKWKVLFDNTEYKIGRIYQRNFKEKYERYLLNYYVSI